MKHIYPLLFLTAAFALACGKTDPDTTTDTTDDNPAVVEDPVAPAADAEDDLATTTFDRTITITYSATEAAVEGDENSIVAVNGNHVTVNNTTTEKIKYILMGTSADGSFKLYSQKKQALYLRDLSLTNPSGAVINIQSGKRSFLVLEGTSALYDSSTATYEATGSEDQKAVVFSEGQIIVCGDGALTIWVRNTVGKNGLTSDDYVHLVGEPILRIVAVSGAGHGLKGKDYVRISELSTLNVTTKADMKKAIVSDGYVLVEGGTVTCNVSGGTAYDSEDAEYKGSAGIKADGYFAMTGGSVTITNTGNGGKGVHAGSYDYDAVNHKVPDSYITGGTLTITVKGDEQNDVSAKGMKIGWATKNGTDDHAKVTAYAGNLFIGGGKITVTAEGGEGIESKGDLVISGGEVSVTSKADDAINCQAEMNIKGGYVYAYSSANDALDSNHDTIFSGGVVFAVSTCGGAELGIDANSEERYKVYIKSGATVIAYGGIESGFSAEQTVYSMSGTAGSWNALYGTGGFLAAFKAPSGLSSFAVTAPGLSSGYKGVSVAGESFCGGVLATTGITGGTSVTLGNYSAGGGGGGFPGGGGGRPRP